MGCKIDAWSAQLHADRLTVIGTGECTQGGYQLSLEFTNEGIVDEPDLIALRLRIEEPDAGTNAITPARVEWSHEGMSAIRRVRIDTPEGAGGGMISVERSP